VKKKLGVCPNGTVYQVDGEDWKKCKEAIAQSNSSSYKNGDLTKEDYNREKKFLSGMQLSVFYGASVYVLENNKQIVSYNISRVGKRKYGEWGIYINMASFVGSFTGFIFHCKMGYNFWGWDKEGKLLTDTPLCNWDIEDSEVKRIPSGSVIPRHIKKVPHALIGPMTDRALESFARSEECPYRKQYISSGFRVWSICHGSQNMG